MFMDKNNYIHVESSKLVYFSIDLLKRNMYLFRKFLVKK